MQKDVREKGWQKLAALQEAKSEQAAVIAQTLVETTKRFDKEQENLKKELGTGATAEGRALIDVWPRLAAFIKAELHDAAGKSDPPGNLDITLRRLDDADAIAVNVLRAYFR
jgi:hypothetical protein